MNEEIKEIIEHIKTYPEKIYCLSEKEKIRILDYIINLQEENKFLKLNNPEMNIEHFRIIKENKIKIDRLRKENKILKENNQSYQEEMARTWKIADDYKSRCEKAIELINKRKEEDNGIGWVEMRTEEYFEECDEIINILNGSDEN